MHSTNQKAISSFLSTLGILLGVAAGQTALAGSESPIATQDVAVSAPQAAAPMSGEKVYNEVCIACHSPPGAGGAPAFGNKEAWAPRIAQGKDTLFNHALNGFSNKTGGLMPKKGGRLDLSDEEIIGAVEYMVGQVTP